MSEAPQYASLSTFSSSSNYSVVAPFAADITTANTGSVRYSESFHSQLSEVSNHISLVTGNVFNGKWMLVAEWNGVPLLSGSTVSKIRHNVSTCIKIVQVYTCIHIRVHSYACTVYTCF